MPDLKLTEIANVLNAEVINFKKDIVFKDYLFDSRLLEDKSSLFFALISDKNDGHNYLSNFKGRDNVAAVVSKDVKGIDIPLIKVDDTKKAFFELATYVRKKHKRTKYIAITGSAGKTTTKEFVYDILSQKYKVYKSYKNWNNYLGLSFSLLKMDNDVDFAVFELAMSYPGIGEIDLLAKILVPDIAIVLNIFPVHLEFLKTIDNVAKAKSEVFNYMNSDSIGFYNGDSKELNEIVKNMKFRKVSFGKNKSNDIVLKEILDLKEKKLIRIDFFGKEYEFVTNLKLQTHIENLFAAIMISKECNMKNFEIQNSISNVKAYEMRGEILNKKGFIIINETYNSNPEALKKVLKWVNDEYKDNDKIAVIGDMYELGKNEVKFHSDIGDFISNLNYKYVVSVGKLADNITKRLLKLGFAEENLFNVENSIEAGKLLKNIANRGDVIVFKGSRGIRLEKAVEEFLK